MKKYFAILIILVILSSCAVAPTFDHVVFPIDLEEYRSRYPHVRFGNDGNSLLLEIEWHTYESYMEEVVSKYIQEWEEYEDSIEFFLKSDEYKVNYTEHMNGNIYQLEYNSTLIKDNILYMTKLINGKAPGYFQGVAARIEMYDDRINSEGYYVWEPIYPCFIVIRHYDEDYVWHEDYEMWVYSLEEYQYYLKKDVIPLCDGLLKKGYITQEEYDIHTTDDPVVKFIKRLWGE